MDTAVKEARVESIKHIHDREAGVHRPESMRANAGKASLVCPLRGAVPAHVRKDPEQQQGRCEYGLELRSEGLLTALSATMRIDSPPIPADAASAPPFRRLSPGRPFAVP